MTTDPDVPDPLNEPPTGEDDAGGGDVTGGGLPTMGGIPDSGGGEPEPDVDTGGPFTQIAPPT